MLDTEIFDLHENYGQSEFLDPNPSICVVWTAKMAHSHVTVHEDLLGVGGGGGGGGGGYLFREGIPMLSSLLSYVHDINEVNLIISYDTKLNVSPPGSAVI